jgi:two-component system phosphate regulon sensor histidine kinase PhoR
LNLDAERARGQDLLEWLYRIFQVSVPKQLLLTPVEKSVRFEISRPEQPNSAPLFLSANLDVIPLPAGRIAGTIWTLRDVTQSKKETKMHRTFLSLVSHKLRTPIACITEHVSLLQDGLLGELTGDQRNSIDRVQDQAARLKELVDEMLNFIQIDESDLDHAADAFIVEDVLKPRLDRLVQRHAAKKPAIKLEFPKGLYALGMPSEHFQIVVENLVDNAIKFCDKPQAEVRIAYAQTAEGQHEFTVADNGPGIPHEEFERIFEEFYQIDKYFTGNVAGVGLGLPLTRRLVMKAGGRIWVTSQLGGGTVFHFTVPVVGTVLHQAA